MKIICTCDLYNKAKKMNILTKSTRKNSANSRAHITTQANVPKSKTLKCEGSISQDTLPNENDH
jgi:hypothetical protein